MLPVVLVLLGASGALGLDCRNLVPGLDKQSRGVDITRLDLMPLDTLSTQDGYKSPIITYTCNSHKQQAIDGHTYNVPDQVWVISEIPSGTISTSVDVVKTTEEARKTMTTNAGISGSYGRFAFSASTTFSRTQTSLAKHDKTVETAKAFFGARKMDLQHSSHLALGTVAMEQLNHLPASYASNPIGYENFIKQFGTHYVSSGTFGGLMMQYMETSSDYSETIMQVAQATCMMVLDGRNHSEQSLEVQASASFGKLISAHGGHTSTSSHADTSFTQKTSTTVKYYGGNANLLSSNGISSWQPTISTHPWLFSSQLAPISDLVHDASRRNSLNIAVRDYVLRSYLTVELPRLLHTLPSVTLTQTTARNLLSKIHAMERKRPLVESEVAALGHEVETQYKEIFLSYHRNDDNFHQVNNYDQQFTLDCPAGQIITHIWSQHNNHNEDRVWKFGCNYAPGLGVLTNCHWTDYVNTWDQTFTFSCPHNGVIKGWSSYHDNHYEDRRFRFKCCEVDHAQTTSCSFTNYLNTFDATFQYYIDYHHVLKGVSSYHDNHYEDRRFRFQKCALRFY